MAQQADENQHIVKSYDDEINALQRHLIQMGGLVEKQVSDAIRALKERDVEAAAHVIEQDDQIDLMEEEIDKEAIRLLATRQPMAVDLRLVAMATKISNDLERIGDYAANMANRYPEARCFGVDISQEMLTTAEASIRHRNLGERIRLSRGDATNFDGAAILGQPVFERIFISYSLSMIPSWRATLERAMRALAPGGRLLLVDFGDFRGWPGWFRTSMTGWLSIFHVMPRLDLVEEAVTHFTGYLQGENLACAMALADVFVFPSRTDTFGLVMIEALASGVPVAAYDVPEPRDIITSDRVGAIGEDLGASVRRALRCSPERCRIHALSFSWDHAAEQFERYLAPIGLILKARLQRTSLAGSQGTATGSQMLAKPK